MAYRDYEDPRMLERMVRECEDALNHAEGEDEFFYYHEELEDLRQRLNFAWQDEEFEMYD